MSITHVERPENEAIARAVNDEIGRLVGRDDRLRGVSRCGLAFMQAMGMTVQDPGERAALLQKCIPWAASTVKWAASTSHTAGAGKQTQRRVQVSGRR
jgi:hypothetical protein